MIFEKVRGILVENLACAEEEVKLESNLIEDLGADSLDLVDISLELEDIYGLEVKDEDFASLNTVEDIVKYIEEKK